MDNILFRVTALRPDGARHTHYIAAPTESAALDHYASMTHKHHPQEVVIATPCAHRLIMPPWTELPSIDSPLGAEEPVSRPIMLPPQCTGICHQGRVPCDCTSDPLDALQRCALAKWLSASCALVTGAYALACWLSK